MSKVIELAREAGIVFPETQEDSFTCWIEELTQFYTLARADLNDKGVSLEAECERRKTQFASAEFAVNELKAENAKLRKALSDLLNSEWQDDDGDERLESARKQARAALGEKND